MTLAIVITKNIIESMDGQSTIPILFFVVVVHLIAQFRFNLIEKLWLLISTDHLVVDDV